MGLAVNDGAVEKKRDKGHGAHWLGLATSASALFLTQEPLNQDNQLFHNQWINNLKKTSQNPEILEKYKTTDQKNENQHTVNLGANRQT